jgi:hypothetical protein
MVSVLTNDTDAEGDTLTVTGVTDGTYGTVTHSGSTATYTHDGSDPAPDSFTYTISDGNGGTDTGNVSITVTE